MNKTPRERALASVQAVAERTTDPDVYELARALETLLSGRDVVHAAREASHATD